MPRPKLTVDLSGPFFTKDPAKTFRENVRRMLEGLAEEGANTVRAAWPKGSTPADPHPGAGAAGTIGRIKSLSGKPWAMTAVVSATFVYPWPHGGQKQYRGGKAEARVGMFRRTANAMRSSRTVLAANLVEGLE